MIKDALEYLVGLKRQEQLEIDGVNYLLSNYKQVSPPSFPRIQCSNLDSLVEYINKDEDGSIKKYGGIVQVISPCEVALLGRADLDKNNRMTLMYCDANIPQITFNKFINKESMIIQLQSKFTSFDVELSDGKITKEFGSLKDLLRVCGNIQSESVSQFNDDGISQKVSVKSGIETKENIKVPNPVTLAPFRTFTEISQVPSNFVFRINKTGSDCIEMALFEADGNAWEGRAIKKIKEYLEKRISLTVLA